MLLSSKIEKKKKRLRSEKFTFSSNAAILNPHVNDMAKLFLKLIPLYNQKHFTAIR